MGCKSFDLVAVAAEGAQSFFGPGIEDVANPGQLDIQVFLCEEILQTVVIWILLGVGFHLVQPLRCSETQCAAKLFSTNTESDNSETYRLATHRTRWRWWRSFYVQRFKQKVLFAFCVAGDFRAGVPDTADQRQTAKSFQKVSSRPFSEYAILFIHSSSFFDCY